ncbi:hypothetical protein NE237_007149 [Protea cynaroides]|uniref:Uncharacterized protein n=1 Tax=Protea cynaroides TaxID=273540 RepID=A0A9Q0QVU5_9MAGN|nr:hypothetical protein NE237_007149 [Protea cynaroides]
MRTVRNLPVPVALDCGFNDSLNKEGTQVIPRDSVGEDEEDGLVWLIEGIVQEVRVMGAQWLVTLKKGKLFATDAPTGVGVVGRTKASEVKTKISFWPRGSDRREGDTIHACLIFVVPTNGCDDPAAGSAGAGQDTTTDEVPYMVKTMGDLGNNMGIP